MNVVFRSSAEHLMRGGLESEGRAVYMPGRYFRRRQASKFCKPKDRSSTSLSTPDSIAVVSRAIATSSHAKMPLLGRKFPAQVGRSIKIARVTSLQLDRIANSTATTAKPMWPFYVSGMLKTGYGILEKIR